MLVTEILSRIPQENLGLGQAHLRELGSLLRSENECHKKSWKIRNRCKSNVNALPHPLWSYLAS